MEKTQFKALIFDSIYNAHRGVIAYMRIFSGQIKAGDVIYFLATNTKSSCQEIGVFKPKMESISLLGAGEVGYLITGLKDLSSVRVGDTVSSVNDKNHALAGYKPVEPKVFASLFTTSQEDYPKLRDAIGKLKLNDAALMYEPESIPALGFGYRCGFLGLLHLDIVKERLEREFDLDLIVTSPSVEYKVVLNNSDTQNKTISKAEQAKRIGLENLAFADIDTFLNSLQD
jgi:GTP-binding protein LepA